MPFAVRNLSVLCYANGFTLWHYRAGAETLAGVGRPGFFSDASDMIASGDMLMVSAADGAKIFALTRADREVLTAPLA